MLTFGIHLLVTHDSFLAFEGLTYQDTFTDGGKEISALCAKNKGIRPCPGGKFFSKSSGIQKFACNTLIGNFMPDGDRIRQLCEERCNKIFTTYDIFEVFLFC